MEVHIFMAKKGTKQKVYSAEFKICVIMDMQEHHLAYRETVRKYWNTENRSQEDLYLKTIKRWERIFLEEGAKGLMKERRGQGIVSEGKKRGRPPKLDKKFEEDLIAQNKRLRMENEYLKKLQALVQERIEQENKKR